MPSVDLVTVGSLFAEVTPVQAGETLAEAHRYTPRKQVGLRALDGSVRDW